MVGGLGGHLLRTEAPPGRPRQPVTTNEKAARAKTRFAILTLWHFFVSKNFFCFSSASSNWTIRCSASAFVLRPHREFFVIFQIRIFSKLTQMQLSIVKKSCLKSEQWEYVHFALQYLSSVKIAGKLSREKLKDQNLQICASIVILWHWKKLNLENWVLLWTNSVVL